MKTILYISYFFPPFNRSASRRSAKICKYLSRQGWKVVVLTRKLDLSLEDESLDMGLLKDVEQIERIEVSDPGMNIRVNTIYQEKHADGNLSKGKFYKKFKAKMKRFLKEFIFYPDENFLWFFKSLPAVYKIVRQYNPSVIFSSYGPGSAHLLGLFGKMVGCACWIADFRDPWSASPYHNRKGPLRSAIRITERLVCNTADLVTCVSFSMEQYFKNLVNRPDKVNFLPNGYDPEDYADFQLSSQAETSLETGFRILYAGGLYDGLRDPSAVFKALKRLHDKGKVQLEKIEFVYLGKEGTLLESMAEKHDMRPIIVDHGFVSFARVKKEMVKADLLLLLMPDRKSESVFIPGKFYEYLGTGRNILALGYEKGDLSKLMDGLDAGYILSPSRIDDIEKVVEKYYMDSILTSTFEPADQKSGNIEFSHPQIASKLSSLISSHDKKQSL